MLNFSERVLRKIERLFFLPRRKKQFLRQGGGFVAPNYIMLDSLLPDGVVVDVGCASDPELSKALMGSHGLPAYGVDPTAKHARALQDLQTASSGLFTHLPYALTASPGKIAFHEPLSAESASVLAEHTNASGEGVRTYQVEAIDLKGLMKLIDGEPISILKIDLEGAEFELLGRIEPSDLESVRQIFVEFHHHCTSYAFSDTERLVRRLESFGWKSFTLDRHNYLFVNPEYPAPSSSP